MSAYNASMPNTIKAFELGSILVVSLVLVTATYSQYVLHQPYLCWECLLSWDAFVQRLIDTWTTIIIAIPFWIAMYYIKKRVRVWNSV